MARGLQHATFNRSALVRVLSGTLPEVSGLNYDFGERLGRWLDISDALSLYSTLTPRAGDEAPAKPAPARSTASEGVPAKRAAKRSPKHR